MNKKTVALSDEDYFRLILHLRQCYNKQIADVLMLQAACGLRVSDAVSMRFSEIIFENNRYRFEKIEKKTKKKRVFTISYEIVNYLKINYHQDKIFNVSVRRIQQALQRSCSELCITYSVSTHSFRKYFATSVYNRTHDIRLVCELLQHSSVAITQKYISVSSEAIEAQLQKQSETAFFF